MDLRWALCEPNSDRVELVFDLSAPATALLKHHDDTPPQGYHAVELWTFDSAGGFRGLIADGFSGARQISSPGWVGDSLTWTHVRNAEQSERFVYTKLGSSRLRIDWLVAKQSSPSRLGDTLTCERT